MCIRASTDRRRRLLSVHVSAPLFSHYPGLLLVSNSYREFNELWQLEVCADLPDVISCVVINDKRKGRKNEERVGRVTVEVRIGVDPASNTLYRKFCYCVQQVARFFAYI